MSLVFSDEDLARFPEDTSKLHQGVLNMHEVPD